MKLIVGFIPLLDCASLVAAVEMGFAAAEDLELTMVRETSWANVRDRVVIGHFDAAHMLGPMTVAATLGLGHVKVPLIAPMALGLGGNAVTVSSHLWEKLSAQGATLGGDPREHGAALKRVLGARQRAGLQPLVFGMVYPFSCHNYELRYWLAASRIDAEQEVRLVVIPPPFLADALRLGQIDGFCVGEPWNSVAVTAGVGTILFPTTAIWPHSPEKVLGCRLEWAQRHPKQLAALVRVLRRAALWCEEAKNHAQLASLLAQPKYVGAPATLLRQALGNRLCLSPGSTPSQLQDFFAPARGAATFPWVSHALWFYAQMVRWQQTTFCAHDLAAVRATYRPDLYRAALESLGESLPAEDVRTERFFDGATFDPRAS